MAHSHLRGRKFQELSASYKRWNDLAGGHKLTEERAATDTAEKGDTCHGRKSLHTFMEVVIFGTIPTSNETIEHIFVQIFG